MKLFRKFSPLLFLSSLGAGGMAVAGFAFFQYTFPHGEGLVHIGQVHTGISPIQEILFRSVEAAMLLFIIAHIILTAVFVRQLTVWMKSDEYRQMLPDPQTNSALVTPFISVIMTLNVVIGPIRYYSPFFAENLQALMPYGFAGWAILWLWLMVVEIKLLSIGFTKSFDISKITFGWLLHPFALAMATVTGTGLAAMSHDPGIAHAAAFMSVVSGTMGVFLLSVKLNSLFQSHFAAHGLPDKQFLPSLLIIVPNITLFSISLFRLGHYLEHHHGASLGSYYLAVILLGFAFQTWYLAFGLTLLSEYVRKHLLTEFHPSMWGLICPIVAYTVLGSFLYSLFVQSPILYGVILVMGLLGTGLFVVLLSRQILCANSSNENGKVSCS